MAGTRLVLQATFLIQILVLVTVSFYLACIQQQSQWQKQQQHGSIASPNAGWLVDRSGVQLLKQIANQNNNQETRVKIDLEECAAAEVWYPWYMPLYERFSWLVSCAFDAMQDTDAILQNKQESHEALQSDLKKWQVPINLDSNSNLVRENDSRINNNGRIMHHPWYHITVTLLDEDVASHAINQVAEDNSTCNIAAREVQVHLSQLFSHYTNSILKPRLAELSEENGLKLTLSTRTLGYLPVDLGEAAKKRTFQGKPAADDDDSSARKPKNVLQEWYQRKTTVPSHKKSSVSTNHETVSSFLYRSVDTSFASHLLRATLPSTHRVLPSAVEPEFIEFIVWIPSIGETPSFFVDRGGQKSSLGRTVSVAPGGVTMLNLPNDVLSESLCSSSTTNDAGMVDPMTKDAQTGNENHDETKEQISASQEQNCPLQEADTLLKQSLQQSIANVASLVENHPALPQQGETQGTSTSSKEASCKTLVQGYQAVAKGVNQLLALLEERQMMPFQQRMARHLCRATQLLHQTYSICSSNKTQAQQALHEAHVILLYLQKAFVMMERLYTPPEHVFAVYAPLVLPLLLPLWIGLRREWKRFCRLRKQERVR